MHLTEQDLVLIYYGESPAPEHLASCSECSTQYRRLAAWLDRVTEDAVPPMPLDLPTRIAALLPSRRRWPRIAVPVGVAAALLLAFQIGRRFPDQPAPPPPARNALLQIALPDHLERSRVVLASVANASAGLDISTERRIAGDLLESNRLLRRSAASADQGAYEDLLEDVERLLAELAHSPAAPSAARLRELQDSIRAQALVFRLRVIESQLRNRENIQ